MDRFEYVMVLISIIVGLGLAHVLVGVGGIIDRRADGDRPLALSLAHAIWLTFMFVWMVQFWWWEYRFSELGVDWSMGLYFFLVLYAVSLFLTAVILVPRSWDRVDSLGDYFIRRRVWFYSGLFLCSCIDVIDGYLKGGSDYLFGVLGPSTWLLWALTIPVCIVGVRSTRLRTHNIGAGSLISVQLTQGFLDLWTLGL